MGITSGLVSALAGPDRGKQEPRPGNLTERDAYETLKKIHSKLLINNEWVAPKKGGKLPVIDPRNGNTILEVAAASTEDADEAIKAARKAFDEGPWPRMTGVERGRLMARLAEMMEQRKTEFALLETLDAGKPIHQSLIMDVQGSIDHFRYFAGWASKITGKELRTATPHRAFTYHEPVGVVAAIIPWNFPLMEAAWKLAPSLACGNTIVLKSSKETALSALHLAQLFVEVGFPPGVMNLLTGAGKEVGGALTHSKQVDHVSFTGSTSVGKHVGTMAADVLKPVTLELGGKSPVVVTPGVDINEAAEVVRWALLFNHGQCCAAGTRLYVHESIYDEFMNTYLQKIKEWRVGDPFGDVDQGPQINQSQIDKIEYYVKEGQKEGAKIAFGGHRIGDKGYYYAPTIFVDVHDKMKIAQEEIFGPVQVVMKYKEIPEVIRRCNDNPYGLAAGVICRDQLTIDTLIRGIQAGTVWVNCYNLFDAAVPFGGYKDSGIGREKGEYALGNYTQIKAVYEPLKDVAWM